MCLVAYDPIAVAEDLKERTEEAMALSFDIKEKIPEGTYLAICDMLKGQYEAIGHLLKKQYRYMIPFDDWSKDDLTILKDFLAETDEQTTQTMELMQQCDEYKELHESFTDYFND